MIDALSSPLTQTSVVQTETAAVSSSLWEVQLMAKLHSLPDSSVVTRKGKEVYLQYIMQPGSSINAQHFLCLAIFMQWPHLYQIYY